jgi:hypothetical protein
MGNVLMQGIAGLGGFLGLPMSAEGDRAALLGELLAAGMPLVGGVKALKQGIKAFHGSPHDFDQFSLSKIGTGEGAQAYGHGLYFADSEGVARSYRDNLSGVRAEPTIAIDPEVMKKLRFNSGPGFGSTQKYIENAAKMTNGDMPAAAQKLRQSAADKMSAAETIGTKDGLERARLFQAQAHEAADLIDSGAVKISDNPGRMYEVNIDADPEDFLDWDAPALSTAQQKALRSLGVRRAEGGKDAYVAVRNKAIQAAGEHRGFKAPGIQDPDGLGDIGSIFDVDVSPSSQGGYEQADYDRIRQAFALHRDEMTPTEWVKVNAMTSGGDYDAVASQLLKDRGIPGIKYFDQGSRTAGQGSRNYVVFDDTKISIVRKFGIAAALSAGAISEIEARQLQAQGYQ